jgi:hypothetical protein
MASLASAKPRALAQSAINLCREPGPCIAPDQVAPRPQMRPSQRSLRQLSLSHPVEDWGEVDLLLAVRWVVSAGSEKPLK